MTIRRELIDELLKDYETPQDILGEGGLLKELTKAVVERCLETELDTHLGYPKHGRKGNANGNLHNGRSQKTVKGEQGHIDIDIPRDRQGTFEPQLVKKGQTRLEATDRQNPGAVCSPHDHPRYSSTGASTVWSGGVPDAHFQCDRGGHG
jgi:putative transposase